MVAVVYGDRLRNVEREIAHYALVYGQDGPVEIRVINPDNGEQII